MDVRAAVFVSKILGPQPSQPPLDVHGGQTPFALGLPDEFPLAPLSWIRRRNRGSGSQGLLGLFRPKAQGGGTGRADGNSARLA